MSNKFCNTHHLFFKKNLDILNNKDNEIKFYRTLYTLNKDKIELLNKIFLEKITKNWGKIQNYLKNLRKIVKVVKTSGNLKDFEIERMIDEYLSLEKKMKSPETFLKHITKFIYRKNLYAEVKELLFILSNKHSCEIILNKDLSKEKCSKRYIEKIIKLANGNINILIKLLYPKVKSVKNYFGKIEYETAYMFFKCLKLMEKHKIDPIKGLKLDVKLTKPKKLKEILEDLDLNYIMESGNDFDDKKFDVRSISEYILLLKKRGHTLWYAVNFVWNNIYGCGDCIVNEITNSNVVSMNNIELQKQNYLTAIKIYIMCRESYISNINVFQNFE